MMFAVLIVRGGVVRWRIKNVQVFLSNLNKLFYFADFILNCLFILGRACLRVLPICRIGRMLSDLVLTLLLLELSRFCGLFLLFGLPCRIQCGGLVL